MASSVELQEKFQLPGASITLTRRLSNHSVLSFVVTGFLKLKIEADLITPGLRATSWDSLQWDNRCLKLMGSVLAEVGKKGFHERAVTAT